MVIRTFKHFFIESFGSFRLVVGDYWNTCTGPHSRNAFKYYVCQIVQQYVLFKSDYLSVFMAKMQNKVRKSKILNTCIIVWILNNFKIRIEIFLLLILIDLYEIIKLLIIVYGLVVKVQVSLNEQFFNMINQGLLLNLQCLFVQFFIVLFKWSINFLRFLIPFIMNPFQILNVFNTVFLFAQILFCFLNSLILHFYPTMLQLLIQLFFLLLYYFPIFATQQLGLQKLAHRIEVGGAGYFLILANVLVVKLGEIHHNLLFFKISTFVQLLQFCVSSISSLSRTRRAFLFPDTLMPFCRLLCLHLMLFVLIFLFLWVFILHKTIINYNTQRQYQIKQQQIKVCLMIHIIYYLYTALNFYIFSSSYIFCTNNFNNLSLISLGIFYSWSSISRSICLHQTHNSIYIQHFFYYFYDCYYGCQFFIYSCNG